MPEAVRTLNEAGSRLFREFVERQRGGGFEPPPFHLLTDDETSLPAGFEASIEVRDFPSRVEFGRYLVEALKSAERRRISRDAGLWNWLALRYFNQLCPPDDKGMRKPLAAGHYVLEGRFAHNRYYRHLVRAAWYAMALHGEDGAILLTSAGKPTPGIGQWGEISEQLAAYQDILGSRTAMVVAARLYLDPARGTKPGAASPSSGGSVRRLATVLRQLSRTHDLWTAAPEEIIAMLPDEFSPFRGDPRPAKKRSLLRRVFGAADARE